MIRSRPARAHSHSAPLSGLGLASLLGLLFALPGAWEVWLANGQLFTTDSDIAVVVQDSIWLTPLGRDLILFGLTQTLLHIVFGLGCWALACASEFAWPRSGVSRRLWIFAWYLLCGFWLLVFHADLFPRTHLGTRYLPLAHYELFGIEFTTLTGTLLACALGATTMAAIWHAWRGRSSTRPATRRILVTTAVLACTVVIAASIGSGLRPVGTSAQPHIILLGIDSLRPERNVGPDSASLTPRLDQFLAPAVIFDDAITPLPRTYPSWVSLLTGRHPHSSGAIVNLLPREMVDTTGSLPELLHARGYRTVYATDEVRFSNIDESYGFDDAIIPPIGAADFLIGVLSDMPLSNLLTNTTIGRWLLPHAYANRAFAKLYDPDTFVERLDTELRFDEPTFLALHLTLPHWPYFWRDKSTTQNPENSRLIASYAAAVRRTDRQFSDIIALLRARGALVNAIVVVLSDHGESLGTADDLPFADPGDPPAAYPTGHGTNVLSPNQYRVVLAWQTFGETPLGTLHPAHTDAPVSLEDIAPTLVDALELRASHQADGRSLVDLLHRVPDAGQAFSGRIRFTETEFNPPGFEPGTTPNPDQFKSAVSNYRLNPTTGRLELTARAVQTTVLLNRQYAAIQGNRVLAALPSQHGGYRYVVADRSRDAGKSAAGPPDPDSDATLTALGNALRQRFPALRPMPTAQPE